MNGRGGMNRRGGVSEMGGKKDKQGLITVLGHAPHGTYVGSHGKYVHACTRASKQSRCKSLYAEMGISHHMWRNTIGDFVSPIDNIRMWH